MNTIKSGEKLNEFLVDIFNYILRLEEQSLSKGEHKSLSLNELHVLEAAQKCAEGGSEPGMAEIAARLCVSPGTLSVAVKTLEQKGYVTRGRNFQDKRRVCVRLLDKSRWALERHAQFHAELVESVVNALSQEELSAFTLGVNALHTFFKSYKLPRN